MSHYAFKEKPHFDLGYVHKYPLTVDAQLTAPVDCAFNVGDLVTFTNDNGVKFTDKRITGFSTTVDYGRFVYLDFDCWWFAVDPKELTLQVAHK